MNEARLAEALEYAILIIASYQADIRNSDDPHLELPLPQPLSDYGFCQGEIYLGAVERIRGIAAGTRRSGRR